MARSAAGLAPGASRSARTRAPAAGPCSTRPSAACMPPDQQLSGTSQMASAETYGLPVVLVAHGSRDPVAAATTRALARTVAALRPGLDVRVAFLELAVPRPAQVLEAIG